MNLVKISVYGEGYYSGNSYEETIFLLEEDYKLLGEDFDSKEIYLGELDGKHSEVYGEVDVEIIPYDKQMNYNFKRNNDDDTLYWELDRHTDNINEMIHRANTYINGLDSMVDVTYTIRKSKVEELNEWIEKNIK